MGSGFAWVDFTDQDRQQMLNVVQLFRETGTRDELGIGTIRDAFSDHFFPGTSTIQTRTRYMLFIPWIYRGMEGKRVASSDVTKKARDEEVRLIKALLDSGEGHGVIGRDAGPKLQRLPSSIYWAGMGAWGIRLYPGSQDQYHRWLDLYYTRQRSRLPREDGEPVDGAAAPHWHPGLPDPPAGWPAHAGFLLTRQEAGYLHERIAARHGGSLLRFLIDQPGRVLVDLAWEHPMLPDLPERLQSDLEHARNFSECLHGAALLYNLMLAEKRQHEEWVGNYQDAIAEWAETVGARWGVLQAWCGELQRFWSSPALGSARIPSRTVAFVQDWLRLVFGQAVPDRVAGDREARQLIHEREVRLKLARARLENPRALELWPGASGAQQLDYRWRIAQSVLNDIVEGLHSEEDADAGA